MILLIPCSKTFIYLMFDLYSVIARSLPGILYLFTYLVYKFPRRHLSLDDDVEEFLRSHKNLQLIKYSYSDIKKMTNKFNNKLGQGGFGSVYKGKLRSNQIVAVKVLVMHNLVGKILSTKWP